MSLQDDLNWRHACKGMNGMKVPQEKVDKILEAINLAPTSLGLQAYKVIVIENQELKERIREEACPQQPITGCSHLLVFAPYTQITDAYLDEYFDLIRRKRNPEKEWCDNYRKRIEFFIEKNYNYFEAWVAHQVYIALGIGCVAAANERIDSVSIEGFDKAVLNKILDLPSKHLSAQILLPLGIKDPETDWMNGLPKVRKDLRDLIEVIK